MATGLLLHHLGVEQGPATYSDNVQWGVQPKGASKWPRYVAIGFLLIAVVAVLVALSWSLAGKLETPPLTLYFGFTELVVAAALSIPAIRSYWSYRAIERDVKANLVGEIAVDGTSAWVVDEQARVPITAIKNLKCYGLHETRIRMGVQTASKTLGFDPSHLLIDPLMERDGSLDPSSPRPLPPLFPVSRRSRLPDAG